MATINFFIEKNKVTNKDQPCLIYLRYDHNRKKTLISTNIRASVNQLNWVRDRGHDKIKINQPLKKSFSGYLKANAELKRLYENLFSALCDAKELGDETCSKVKEIYNGQSNKLGDVKTILEGIDKYVSLYKTEHRPRSITNYDKNLRLHIANYDKFKNREHTLLDLNHEFELSFKSFLRSNESLSESSVDNNIKYLKSLCNKLSQLGIKVNPTVKSFKRASKSVIDSDIIALNDKEMKILSQSKDLESDHLNQVKELFTFHCFTGLRVGDLMRFHKNMITNRNRIRTRSEKTNSLIEVPILPEAMKILKKYDYELPKISEQKYNKAIKRVLEKLKINRKLEQLDYQPIHKVATSHLAKKSFISYCLNSKSLSPIQVSKITGTNVETILRYYATADMDEIEMKLLNT